MARLLKRRGALRDATADLLARLEEKIERAEKELEALRREEKMLKQRMEEEEE